MVRAGELPERRTFLRVYLTSVREGLIQDLGPSEADLTAAQAVLIDRVISKLSILRCIEEHVREKGVFTKAGELDSVLSKSYLAWANSIRLDLQALGIDKRAAEGVLDPLTLAKVIDAEKAAEKGQACKGRQKEADDQGIAQPCASRAAGDGLQGQEESGKDRAS